MYFLKEKLYNFIKFLNRRLLLEYKIIFSVITILLVLRSIYYLFIKAQNLFKENPYTFILSFILISLGIFLMWRNHTFSKNKTTINTKKFKIYTLTRTQKHNHNMIDTKGGNYNENIQGNYIDGDYINHHVTIQGCQVEVSSENIDQILNEFREILSKMISQNSNPLEVISQFAQELAEELHKNPEVENDFNADKNIGEKELVDIILKLILIQNNKQENSYLQKLNNVSSVDLKDFEDEEEQDRYIFTYKEYTIDIAKDHWNEWHYKIQNTCHFSLRTTDKIYISPYGFPLKEEAYNQAKQKIDQKRFDNWKNNIDNW